MQTEDASLDAEVALREAELWEQRAKRQSEWGTDMVQAQIAEDEIAAAEAALARARERAGEATIRSPADGVFVSPLGSDLAGRFVHQGELIGYVVGPSVSTVRVVLPQEDEPLVRDRTRSLEVRLSGELDTRPVGHDPAAGAGGNRQASEPRPRHHGRRTRGRRPADPDGLRTVETVFQLDVALPRRCGVAGDRPACLRALRPRRASRWRCSAYRELRQLFLRQIAV